MPPEIPAPDGSSPKTQRFDGPPPMIIDPAKRYSAVLTTSKGEITIALDPNAAPRTVNNFVFLARWHYYDGVGFHRIIPGFMCQGGDPDGTGRGGPGYRFEDELPPAGRYEIGSLAMANAGPNTNGSQFFITVVPTPWLNNKHTIFGEVVSGQDIVRRVANEVPKGAGDRPRTDVRINKLTISAQP